MKTQLSTHAKPTRASAPRRNSDHDFDEDTNPNTLSAAKKPREAVPPLDDRKPKATNDEMELASLQLSIEEAASTMKSLREESPPKRKIQTEAEQSFERTCAIHGQPMCQAGDMCRMLDAHVVVGGKGSNGSACCKCEDTFHHTCLFLMEGYMYCSHCYHLYVVSQCSTD